jgi:hypothetical protein
VLERISQLTLIVSQRAVKIQRRIEYKTRQQRCGESPEKQVPPPFEAGPSISSLFEYQR